MSQPELDTDGGDEGGDEGGDSGDEVIAEFDGEESGTGGSGVEAVGEADLGIEDDNDIVAGFDGFEGSDDTSSSDTSSGGSSGGGGGGGPSVAAAIEEGMAEVACIGLVGHERERVRSEMQAVASKFKLGYFGERCVEKYLQKDIEDIPPEYGLAASLVAFLAVTMYKRPDGSHKAKQAFTALKAKVTSANTESGEQAESGASGDTEESEDEDTNESDE